VEKHFWVKEFPAELTVCDRKGRLLEMNDAAEAVFSDDGGRALLGSNLLDCHPEPDRSKLEGMLRTGQSNVYINESKGRKTLFFQSPWYLDGQYTGFVEVSFEIPDEIRHHKESEP
jgi:transcriptional regulator with PAS, ATPase and Fis domain